MTPAFTPAVIKGINIHPENPLEFDFIVDKGDENLDGELLKKEAKKLVKYFLASLTVPKEEMWVNLSPYEEGRIISEKFGNTAMGRDLLAQDYMLKQLTASMTFPKESIGSTIQSGETRIKESIRPDLPRTPGTALVRQSDSTLDRILQTPSNIFRTGSTTLGINPSVD